ncbi:MULTISPECIES: YbaB/EbfC family nucleoid-associated protein [Catenuloplanes]|nr:YbaB/EbfC family nucleoid-associated protein [Catenuloplanes niger]
MPGADEVRALVDRLRRRNQQVIDRYEEFVAHSGELTGEGRSLDGAVRVRIDPNGAVTDVDIPDSALRHGAYLAEMILTAIREAQADRALKMTALGESLGTGRVRPMVEDAIPEHTRERIEEREDRRE